MTFEYKLALKYPNGIEYMYYNSETKNMSYGRDINDWINKLYDKRWTNWITYNDQPVFHSQLNIYDKIKHHTSKGHCKGIFCWNDNEIGWLIHSVPKFPEYFSPSSEICVSKIGKSEQVYGQSFMYVYKMYYSKNELEELILHIMKMSPCIYLSRGFDNPMYNKNLKLKKTGELEKYIWSKDVEHYVKKACDEMDFYESLCEMTSTKCKTETWIRGGEVKPSENVIHIRQLIELSETSENNTYRQTQDHSKWAISIPIKANLKHIQVLLETRKMQNKNIQIKRSFFSRLCGCFRKKETKNIGLKNKNTEQCTEPDTNSIKETYWVCVGDLNRMKSQWKRGGGGIVIYDDYLWKAMEDIIYE